MKLFVNKNIRQLYLAVLLTVGILLAAAELWCRVKYGELSWILAIIFLLLMGGIWALLSVYFSRQNRMLEYAVRQIEAYLDGDTDARIECEEDGELFRLFHSVNLLAAILNAHAQQELRGREFLKDTISDISHQLKTPLAALNIYNGLMQEEPSDPSQIGEFTRLSEQELDRMETLVQNLLKITKLDARSIVFEKKEEHLAELMQELEQHFSYRAKGEHKSFTLEGDDAVMLVCDRDWLLEALSNLVKNAFDHTGEGGKISAEWSRFGSVVQIRITDNGSGIHEEDLHHIFKRFYRSRYSQDTQGIGLGLPLAKAIIEGHDGTIEVESRPGICTCFKLLFREPVR